MLKDITLGQYFPGNTVAHRLDPRTKIPLVVLYITALFTAGSFLAYGLMAVVKNAINDNPNAPKIKSKYTLYPKKCKLIHTDNNLAYQSAFFKESTTAPRPRR